MSKEENSLGRQSWPWWRWALTGLSVVGLAFSGYLSWHYLVGGSLIGCSGGSPCDQVLNSRWSSVGGVLPVSGLAAGAYLAMLMASFFIGQATESAVRRLAWCAMLVLVGAVAGSAVWFIIVQKWIIGSFCPYCMAAHINGLLLAALVIWHAPRQSEGDPKNAAPISDTATDSQYVVGIGHTIGLVLVGLVMAGILAACQFHFTPPAVYRGGESQADPSTIDPRTAPLVGSPDAAFIVTALFDYKCRHCQQLHLMLEEAVRHYDGKLGFILCPSPLNPGCNPYIALDLDEFKDSCELAKVGLAVWVANREAFAAFDLWMFSPEPDRLWRPRTLDTARAKAVELVGQAKFDAALANPWIDQYLQTSIRIYGNTVQGGNTAVPKLVFGSRWVTPQPNDVDDLIMMLQESLAVPKP